MLELFNRVKLTISPENDNPFLQGPYAPIADEITATGDALRVIGDIPRDLHGVYVRNSHNQVHESIGMYHPFDGDGMLHALAFEDGKAEYRNRFIRTTGWYAEQAAGRALWPGLTAPREYRRRGWGSIGAMKDNAGTDVIAHAGKLLASMSQCSEPYRIDPRTLETIGPDQDWGRDIQPEGACSHFKVDPDTGEMMFFNFGEHAPFMRYGVVSPDNKLLHYTPIELPGPRWPHDMGITANYTILHDLPLFFDTELLARGNHRLRFHRDVPSRFGIIPRHGENRDVRWFEATPCYILHLSNCYEEGDEVVQDGCISLDPHPPQRNSGATRYEKMRSMLDKHTTRTRMYRWRFNLRTGETKEAFLDDEVTEFPVVDNRIVGRPYRYSYNVLFEPGQWLMSGLKRYDLLTGAQQRYEYGPGRHGSEPQVARRLGGKAEDDGYLVVFVANMNTDLGECLIFDAADITKGPICTIVLPQRLNIGTHACWIEGNRLDGEPQRTAS